MLKTLQLRHSLIKIKPYYLVQHRYTSKNWSEYTRGAIVELKKTAPELFLVKIIPNRFDSTCKSYKRGSVVAFDIVGVAIGTS